MQDLETPARPNIEFSGLLVGQSTAALVFATSDRLERSHEACYQLLDVQGQLRESEFWFLGHDAFGNTEYNSSIRGLIKHIIERVVKDLGVIIRCQKSSIELSIVLEQKHAKHAKSEYRGRPSWY